MKALKVRRSIILISILTITIFSCTKKEKYEDARTPEESIKTFDILEGFKAEVFASEPNVTDPVELTFDEQGNAYVIEMGDYPYKAIRGQGKGQIRKLIDRDADGRIDTSLIFATGLESGTSILPWEGGLLVTAAPEILFLKDTTGDDKADIREVLFTGFFNDNSEAQITSLRYGIDNWIYANNGGQKGEVTFTRRPEVPPLKIGGGDFRFRLDKGLFEVESGTGQYGLDMDDLGHRFYTNNSRHISTSPIPARYLKRHEHISFKSVVNIYAAEPVMYQATRAPWWRAERTKQRQKKYDEEKLNRKEYAEDRFTGASGGTIYAGDTYPKSFYGTHFVGDVAGNLVHRDIIETTSESPFFAAKRSAEEENREFIASTDSWFRPSNFTLGYDGNLYVVDMYRQHIETPVSIPDSLKMDMDFMRGNNYGRIYRIVYADAKPARRTVPNMRNQKTVDLLAHLSHPNRWWRLNAQRVILERKDLSLVPQVKKIFLEGREPIERLHALYILEGLNSLNAELVSKALESSNAGLRKHGAILAERYPELLPKLLAIVDDSVGFVSMQAILSAGQFNSEKVIPVLAKVIEKKYSDMWLKNAVLSSNPGSSYKLIDHLSKNSAFFNATDSAKLSFVYDISHVIGSRKSKDEVLQLTNFLSSESLKDKNEWLQSAVAGLTGGFKRSKVKNTDPAVLNALRRLETASGTGGKEMFQDAIAALKGE